MFIDRANTMLSATRSQDRKRYSLLVTWKGGKLTEPYCFGFTISIPNRALYIMTSGTTSLTVKF